MCPGPKLPNTSKAAQRKAWAYFADWSQIKTTHDVPKIWREGVSYRVAWMDHGKPTNIQEFATLEEAVAGHVSLEFGLPKD